MEDTLFGEFFNPETHLNGIHHEYIKNENNLSTLLQVIDCQYHDNTKYIITTINQGKKRYFQIYDYQIKIIELIKAEYIKCINRFLNRNLKKGKDNKTPSMLTLLFHAEYRKKYNKQSNKYDFINKSVQSCLTYNSETLIAYKIPNIDIDIDLRLIHFHEWIMKLSFNNYTFEVDNFLYSYFDEIKIFKNNQLNEEIYQLLYDNYGLDYEMLPSIKTIPIKLLEHYKKHYSYNIGFFNKGNNKYQLNDAALKNLKVIQNEIKYLELVNHNITDISNPIIDMVNLLELNLTKNQINIIDNRFDSLTKLTKLNLNSNLLEEFPDSICQLINLTELYLARNKINEINRNIKNLKELKKIDLHKNNISTIPKEIEELIKHNKLTKILLSQNNIDYIEFDILQYKKIKISMNYRDKKITTSSSKQDIQTHITETTTPNIKSAVEL